MSKTLYKKITDPKAPRILFLHGFGQNKEMMFPLAKRIEKEFNVLVLDLPGTNNNPLTEAFGIKEYIEYLERVLKEEDFIPDLIVGHSFGGKLASFYTLLHPTTLLLLAPSSIKPKFSLKRFAKIRIYKTFKFLKKVKLISHIPTKYQGSSDYQSTSGVARASFVKIVNSYLSRKDLKRISRDVYIIYGKNDTQITLWQMNHFAKLCKNCHLIVINGDHFAYLLNVSAIAGLISTIVRENK